MLDILVYIIIPYLSIAFFIVGLVFNLSYGKLRNSAPATGFFEKNKLNTGSPLWHYGIIIVLIGHLSGLLLPGLFKLLFTNYSVLLLFEALAVSSGLIAFIGILVLLIRKFAVKSVNKHSLFTDYIFMILLFIQVVLGLIIAINYKWGIAWYVSNITKYLWSILILSPQVKYVEGFPILVTFHFLIAFILFAILPFTRLIHVVFVPIGYFFRKPQRIIYN
ncbi:nitrate reductase, gamma subunit [Deferribacter desulfuricans SSM1]|uniref:Nitrate reductase, gamma subunit n=1 Tax=Deferribacter desulfuricans (strain DSM 14783 / JCM 11476 / NBRC 101012 / SSM1) TaxID=639282 RepID=D3P9Z4_DEFDS|nr:respiratory nitrate reductase subunit gamma [Deferribacter desulfuricans]BAI81534.1 nitrate reductase, gamma subunit [Deferribacter desulfuricans SSM1]